ncbi:hypothetical protein HPB49_022672 [Dermacentor silvarum]|uniref:Uncharacterized protein n=1 Tax=Dermacentor silvarum TaxID=543639 RepID=A0ACB8CHY2_DERSI|nr:hypothetical protein HPB49_022672 [Dermacentor silvarum]
MREHPLKTITAECHEMTSQADFVVACVNVRSLKKRHLDVAHDPILNKAHVLCLTEAWTDGQAFYGIPSYMYVTGGRCLDPSVAAGVTICARTDLSYTLEPVRDLADGLFPMADLCGIRIKETNCHIFCAYVAPKTPADKLAQFINLAIQLLHMRDKPMILVGDFSYDIRRRKYRSPNYHKVMVMSADVNSSLPPPPCLDDFFPSDDEFPDVSKEERELDRKKKPASCCAHGKSTKPVQTEASWLFNSSVDVAVETSRSIDVCKSTQASLVAVKDRKKEPASCCNHGKSTKPVQTEASWLFSSSVDVAVETSRSIDVCKSTQASLVAVKVHRWTETTDLVESKDSDTHVQEIPAPHVRGMPRLTNMDQSPGVSTLYTTQVDEVTLPALGTCGSHRLSQDRLGYEEGGTIVAVTAWSLRQLEETGRKSSRRQSSRSGSGGPRNVAPGDTAFTSSRLGECLSDYVLLDDKDRVPSGN